LLRHCGWQLAASVSSLLVPLGLPLPPRLLSRSVAPQHCAPLDAVLALQCRAATSLAGIAAVLSPSKPPPAVSLPFGDADVAASTASSGRAGDVAMVEVDAASAPDAVDRYFDCVHAVTVALHAHCTVASEALTFESGFGVHASLSRPCAGGDVADIGGVASGAVSSSPSSSQPSSSWRGLLCIVRSLAVLLCTLHRAVDPVHRSRGVSPQQPLHRWRDVDAEATQSVVTRLATGGALHAWLPELQQFLPLLAADATAVDRA
jgi:hypothetical protein